MIFYGNVGAVKVTFKTGNGAAAQIVVKVDGGDDVDVDMSTGSGVFTSDPLGADSVHDIDFTITPEVANGPKVVLSVTVEQAVGGHRLDPDDTNEYPKNPFQINDMPTNGPSDRGFTVDLA